MIGLGLQFVRPALPNPPVKSELQAPPEVKQILKASCYDCHSNETRLVWFDKIVPAYWLVVRDVKRARMHLNFSELGAQPLARQQAILFEALNQIQLGAMPLPSYVRIHPGVTVTPAQVTVLKDYLSGMSPGGATPEAEKTIASVQYESWVFGMSQRRRVQNAPNGIAFEPEYKNWKAISSTDRFDNGTMRVILGNDVAIRAVASKQINPWPDGTMFAKIAWYQQVDGRGRVSTGAFQQVEFMIKDAKKYGSTKGWGWARWRGLELKPYGSSAGFSDECIGCHMPVRENDYIYTMPIGGQKGTP